MTIRDEIEFLRDLAAHPMRRDPERVRECLVHKNVDVRLAAIKAMLAAPTKTRVTEIVEAMASHENWTPMSLYPAARLLGPHIRKRDGKALAAAFPALPQKERGSAYGILCMHCPSPELQETLVSHLFGATDCKIAHMAAGSLSCIPELRSANIWRRCLKHRCAIVAKIARVYLELAK